MRRVDLSERRARLGVRHHLARAASTVEQAAGDLVGLHSSDPVTVYLAAWARTQPFAVADLENALYQRRTLARMLGMRRTMFVVPLELAAVMDAACTRALVPAERRRLIRLIEDHGFAGDGGAWLKRVADKTLAALAARGEATANELREDVAQLRRKFQFGAGKSWRGEVGVSTRMLFYLATTGRIVRGRPRGSWISSQYRWTRTEDWFEGGLPQRDPEEARAELLRRWLRSYGPGTLTDIRWWSGWTLRLTRAALEELGAVEVELDQGSGYLLPSDLEPPPSAPDWVALLPGLDPTVMGWKERDWYLGSHADALFDRNGNAGPTIWFNGRVVGGWAQRPDGAVATRLLEAVPTEAEDRIAAEAERLTAFLGAVRVTPRFRTPLEKGLAG